MKWTQEELDLLREIWPTGVCIKVISSMLKREPSVLYGKAKRIGMMSSRKQAALMKWKEEHK